MFLHTETSLASCESFSSKKCVFNIFVSLVYLLTEYTYLTNMFSILIHNFTIYCRVWNPGDRTIYVRCCGLWDESARLGASWRCYPHTRLRLIPGFEGYIHIKATPRDNSPIPYAHIGLQISSAHLRDNVVGYFFVPLLVKFMTYVPPCILGEE